jgi:hypothetical protein
MVGTVNNGRYRIHNNPVDHFSLADGLSSSPNKRHSWRRHNRPASGEMTGVVAGRLSVRVASSVSQCSPFDR